MYCAMSLLLIFAGSGQVGGSFTAAAIIAAPQTGTLSTNAIVQRTGESSFTASASITVVWGPWSETWSGTAPATGSFTADAFIGADLTHSGSFTASAIIYRPQTGSLTAAAIALTTQTGSLTTAAIVVKTAASSFTASAVIKRTQPQSFVAEAIRMRTYWFGSQEAGF